MKIGYREFLRWLIPIGLFIVFNTMFLLPEYYFKWASTTFFPSTRLSPDLIIGNIKMLFVRDNADLFRVIGEIAFWIIFLFWISKRKKPRLGTNIAIISFVCLIVYHLYYLVSYKIYGEPPNVLNDFTLIREVLPLFLRELGLFNILSAFATLVLFGLLFIAIRFTVRRSIDLLSRIPNQSLVTTAVVLVIILMIWSVGVRWTYDHEHEHPGWKTLHWITPALIKSVSPIRLEDVVAEEEKYLKSFDKELRVQPNIFLFFLESYGSVVQLLKEEGPLYENLIIDLENQLQEKGWGMASTYSLAPVIGGRSWLSFTSAITGLDVNNHLFFNDLLASKYNYPHMVRFLNQHGYHTYRMKTMSNQKQSTEISYALTDRFYAFDKWIKFDDIPYRGFKYDMLGGIPDQYALNYFEENLLDQSNAPFFFFSINMSSHAPWNYTPPFVQNWKDLDSIMDNPDPSSEGISRPDESMRYYQSIAYILKVMTQFILEKVDEGAIVMLVGDHQPPGMTFLCEGIINEFSVPLHIITKDEIVLERCYQKSFSQGLALDTDQPIFMNHMEIYDLWLELLQ